MTPNPGKPPRTTKSLRIKFGSIIFPHLARWDGPYEPSQWGKMNWKLGVDMPPVFIEGCEFVEDAK